MDKKRTDSPDDYYNEGKGLTTQTFFRPDAFFKALDQYEIKNTLIDKPHNRIQAINIDEIHDEKLKTAVYFIQMNLRFSNNWDFQNDNVKIDVIGEVKKNEKGNYYVENIDAINFFTTANLITPNKKSDHSPGMEYHLGEGDTPNKNYLYNKKPFHRTITFSIEDIETICGALIDKVKEEQSKNPSAQQKQEKPHTPTNDRDGKAGAGAG